MASLPRPGKVQAAVVEFVASPRAVVRRILRAAPEVLSQSAVGDRFRVIMADSAIQALSRRLGEQGATLAEARRVPPTLEDVFVSMILERRGAALAAGRVGA